MLLTTKFSTYKLLTTYFYEKRKRFPDFHKLEQALKFLRVNRLQNLWSQDLI